MDWATSQVSSSPSRRRFFDQAVLNEVMESLADFKNDYVRLKLDHHKYAAHANRDGTTSPGALVDQWQMSKKMTDGVEQTTGFAGGWCLFQMGNRITSAGRPRN